MLLQAAAVHACVVQSFFRYGYALLTHALPFSWSLAERGRKGRASYDFGTRSEAGNTGRRAGAFGSASAANNRGSSRSKSLRRSETGS